MDGRCLAQWEQSRMNVEPWCNRKSRETAVSTQMAVAEPREVSPSAKHSASRSDEDVLLAPPILESRI